MTRSRINPQGSILKLTHYRPCWVVGQFDYGRVPGWKTGGSGRIFWGWRQLFNAIAAPSTDALKRSSWYRKRVTRSAQSAALRWNRGWRQPTSPHTN